MKKSLTIAFAAATLAGGLALASAPAQAADWGDHGGSWRGGDRYDGGGWRGGDRYEAGGWRGDHDRRDGDRGDWGGRYGRAYWGGGSWRAPACSWRWSPYWGRYTRACY